MKLHIASYVSLLLALASGAGHAQEVGEQQIDATAYAASTLAEPLTLTCRGSGMSMTPRTIGDDVTVVRAAYNGQVEVVLFTSNDRMRLPNDIITRANNGENGWFKIQDARVSEREITGSVATNMMNRQQFRIDRVAGTIEMSGTKGSFSGDCRKVDLEAGTPKF